MASTSFIVVSMRPRHDKCNTLHSFIKIRLGVSAKSEIGKCAPEHYGG